MIRKSKKELPNVKLTVGAELGLPHLEQLGHDEGAVLAGPLGGHRPLAERVDQHVVVGSLGGGGGRAKEAAVEALEAVRGVGPLEDVPSGHTMENFFASADTDI